MDCPLFLRSVFCALRKRSPFGNLFATTLVFPNDAERNSVTTLLSHVVPLCNLFSGTLLHELCSPKFALKVAFKLNGPSLLVTFRLLLKKRKYSLLLLYLSLPLSLHLLFFPLFTGMQRALFWTF